MWNMLSGLTGGAVFLRDILGYMVPGALVVGTIGATVIATLRANLGDKPEWLFALGLIIFCYATGQVVVGAGYTFVQGPFNRVVELFESATGRPVAPQPPDLAKLQLYRYLYPALFLEADRREPVLMLRIGLSVALFAAAFAVDAPGEIRLLVAVVALAFVANGHSGQRALWHLQQQTLQAAKELEKKKVPYYAWKAPKEKNDD